MNFQKILIARNPATSPRRNPQLYQKVRSRPLIRMPGQRDALSGNGNFGSGSSLPRVAFHRATVLPSGRGYRIQAGSIPQLCRAE